MYPDCLGCVLSQEALLIFPSQRIISDDSGGIGH